MTGSGDLFVEDYLPYNSGIRMVEIDSMKLHFELDHQDKLDTIEIMYE